MKKLLRSFAPAALLILLPGCSDASADEAGAALDAIRSETEKYRDVAVAIADGYERDPLDTCETAAHLGQPAELGAMGIHYLRRDLLGITTDENRLDARGTHTDFLQPAALLYEPQADGSLVLVGLENVVSAEAWRAAGNRRPPSFHGVGYHHHLADAMRVIPEHYDLHLWLYRENPDGLHAQYNRDVSCRHHVIVMPMNHPMGDMPAGPGHAGH
jgi:hypothetical protein